MGGRGNVRRSCVTMPAIIRLSGKQTEKEDVQQRAIPVVLADDHAVTRTGIRSVLTKTADIIIVGEAEDGEQAQQLVAQLRPKILVLDLIMPGPRPAEIEKWVREHYPETAVLILTGHDRDAFLSQAIEEGVSGYLTKDEPAERLISAIRRTARGASLFDEQQIARAKRWKEEVAKKWESLTAREREILVLLAGGKENNKEIASVLVISAKMTEKHLRNIYEKLAVSNRTEAALWWAEHGRDFPT